MALLALLCAQSLLSFHVDGEGPVRFGVPLPAESLARGLRISGGSKARMQWRPLQSVPGVGSDRIWIEVVVSGVTGRAQLFAGGSRNESGPPIEERVAVGEGSDLRIERSYACGERDWLHGEPLFRAVPSDETSFDVGRSGGRLVELSEQWVRRRTRVRIPLRFWRRAGLLPPSGNRGSKIRRHLLDLEKDFEQIQAPGPAGDGDTVRYGREVTNGEFDLTLGLLRIALRTGSAVWMERAYRAARHLVDVDLDRGSGLPFRHGEAHRWVRPDLGHVWIRGLRLVALVFADEELLQDARTITRSLAERVRSAPANAEVERLRDEAWPLWELEESLRFENLTPVAIACDRLQGRILGRWRPEWCAFVYGEGRGNGRDFVERVWLTAGLLLPALGLSSERRGESIALIRSQIEERIVRQTLSRGQGLPTTFRLREGRVEGVGAPRDAAEGFLLIDGLSAKPRRKLLDRFGKQLIRALDPRRDDFATRFALAARSAFVFD